MQNIKKQAGVDRVHVTIMKMAKLGKKNSCRGFWFLTLSLLPDDTITQENPLHSCITATVHVYFSFLDFSL